MLQTFANQQADLGVGEFFLSVALPCHQPQHTHERLHIPYPPELLFKLLPLSRLVNAGEHITVWITQSTEQSLASGVSPNHLKRQHMPFMIRVKRKTFNILFLFTGSRNSIAK